MGITESLKRIEIARRIVLAGRGAACLFVLLPLAISGGGQHDRTLFMAGAVLYIAWTLVVSVLFSTRSQTWQSPWQNSSAIVDGLALALMTAGVGNTVRDPFFAWFALESVIFGMIFARRRAWILTIVLAGFYLAGHAAGGASSGALDVEYFIVNAVIMVLAGVSVSLALDVQQRRRAQVESQRAEVVDLNAKLERSVAELRAITEITELIHSTLDIDTVGPTLLEILEKVIDIPTASLYAIDKTKHETVFSATTIGGRAGRPFTLDDLSTTDTDTPPEGALSCIELLDHNQTLVVFCAEGDAIDALSADDRIVLQAVASELVVAVENSRLYRLTKRLAITDELTDLHNYRYLQQRLDDEIGRAGRYDKKLSLLMLDLDDFKQVNDAHGHRVGDMALHELGQLLKSAVREVDIVARYGGEEFSIILPETDASGAFIVAEKIREAISLHRFKDVDGAPSIHLTASIGLASYPVHANDKESLLRSADDAVYHAKSTGKDRVRAPRLRLRRLPADSLEEAAE